MRIFITPNVFLIDKNVLFDDKILLKSTSNLQVISMLGSLIVSRKSQCRGSYTCFFQFYLNRGSYTRFFFQFYVSRGVSYQEVYGNTKFGSPTVSPDNTYPFQFRMYTILDIIPLLLRVRHLRFLGDVFFNTTDRSVLVFFQFGWLSFYFRLFYAFYIICGGSKNCLKRVFFQRGRSSRKLKELVAIF